MDRDNELIEDSELCVKLDKDRVYHVREIPNPRTPIEYLEVEEVWQQVVPTGGQLLGKGSYGDVFKQECIQDVAGRKVGQLRAVKVVRKGAESTKAYYKEELKAVAKFSMQKFRPYFVRSFGWYEAGNSIYITMECLEHGDLQRYLTRQFSERETCRIASQVVKGLECMHRNNFIHRDLKPENLLVVHRPPERDWSVKICDFGISKRADDRVRAYWTVGIGTPKYMAPEVGLDEPRRKNQKLGEASYTVKADMWSLGSICVRLITGESAFHHTELFRYYHDQGPFNPDAELASNGASQDCRDFVQAVMARDPEHRLSAEQASKHGWFTLNTHLQHPRTPFEPVNPLPDHLEPKDEFEATAKWDSDEEDETENTTIRPGTQHTEDTPLTLTPTECTVSTPPKTTSPQPMENTPPAASLAQHYSDRRPAFRIIGFPATNPSVQPQNQPAGHMGDSWPTTSQAATQHSSGSPHQGQYRSQSSGYSPGVNHGLYHLPPSQNRPAEYTTVPWPVIAQPHPAQHSGNPSGTDPYSAIRGSGNTPNTAPYHTNDYLDSLPSALGNYYPARSSSYPGGNPRPAPQTQPACHTADGSWAQTSNGGPPRNIFTVSRSMTAPSHAMSPNPNRIPDNSSFGNPSSGYQPAVSPSASHTGYESPISQSASNAGYYQPAAIPSTIYAEYGSSAILPPIHPGYQPYPSPSSPSYHRPPTSQSTAQSGYGSPSVSPPATHPSYCQPYPSPPNTGGHHQPAASQSTTQQSGYGTPISPSAAQRSGLHPVATPYGIMHRY